MAVAVAADVVCGLDIEAVFEVEGIFLTAAIPGAAGEVEKECDAEFDCRMARTANLAGCVRSMVKYWRGDCEHNTIRNSE